MKELIKAILAKANGNSTLSSAVSSDIYFERVDTDNVSMPYITYHLISKTPRRAFRSADDWEDCIVQFSIFSEGPNVTESLTVASDLNLAFDRSSLSYDSKSSIACHREGTTGPTWAGEDNVFMTTIDYRIQYN